MSLKFDATGASGEVLYRQEIPFRAMPAFRVDIKPVYLQGFVAVEFDVAGVPELPADAEGRVQLLAEGEHVVAETTSGRFLKAERKSVRLNIAEVDPGDYTLRAALEVAGGAELASMSTPFQVPEPPIWLNNQLGISDRVPPPWTDLSATDREIHVWGAPTRWAMCPCRRR
jgi:hypothetical protein